MLHWLAHLLGLNRCEVHDWMEDQAHCIGARCVTCGKINPATIARWPIIELPTWERPMEFRK